MRGLTKWVLAVAVLLSGGMLWMVATGELTDSAKQDGIADADCHNASTPGAAGQASGHADRKSQTLVPRAQPELLGPVGAGKPRSRPARFSLEAPGADEAWKRWVSAFVSEAQVRPMPPEYRGTPLAWRLKDFHEVTHEQFATLIQRGELLSGWERIALLSRLGRTGQRTEGEVLGSHPRPFTRASTLVHTLYGDALTGILRNAHRDLIRGDREAGRGARLGPEWADVAGGYLSGATAFARDRSLMADAGAWMAMERQVKQLLRMGLREEPHLARAWLDLERAIRRPLVALGDGAAPPHYGGRIRVLELMATSDSAPDLLRLLERWPDTRAWIRASRHDTDRQMPEILYQLLHMIWRSGVEGHRMAFVGALGQLRLQAEFPVEEKSRIVVFCRDLATRPGGVPEFAQQEVLAWSR